MTSQFLFGPQLSLPILNRAEALGLSCTVLFGRKHVVAAKEELRRLRLGNGYFTESFLEVIWCHVECDDFFPYHWMRSTLAMVQRISDYAQVRGATHV